MFGKNEAFRIDSKLGSGGSGAVYKAWHTRLRKYVVLKELNRGAPNDIEVRRNEVEALKNIKNAHVPQVLDFLTENGRYFTIMEFVEGESFDKLLARGRKFTEYQAINWYSQLSAALESIHKHDVCHRDIKPSNIMLTPCGDVCLIDFGAAFVGGYDIRIVSRSPGYASPEQHEVFRRFEGTSGNSESNFSDGVSDTSSCIETRFLSDDLMTEESYATIQAVEKIDWKRSDIYSLGATMHHIITGERPLKQTEGILTVSKPGRFNSALIDIIEQSMQTDPEKRFESAKQLSKAIQNIGKQNAAKKHRLAKKAAAITTIVTITALVTTACRQNRLRSLRRL